jgi:hypothetical protein|nr:MAG TPA: Modulator of Rho-dependent transcription termination (ROF) [Caudoviricetes sp.]
MTTEVRVNLKWGTVNARVDDPVEMVKGIEMHSNENEWCILETGDTKQAVRIADIISMAWSR